MNAYQKEQAESLALVRKYLTSLTGGRKESLMELASDYFSFRKDVDALLVNYFNDVCTAKCYQSRLSACCGRDGIITFFADMVINALVSSEQDMDLLENAATKNNDYSDKCIYLENKGCLWKLKPIVCEMFICDFARNQVFEKFPEAGLKWIRLKQREKHFKWPDRPVLFDQLEEIFISSGYRSPLMYLHNSPGLLRVKQQAGLLGGR